MSIACYAIGETMIAAQGGAPLNIKKPPPKRTVTAVADTTQTPEPR